MYRKNKYMYMDLFYVYKKLADYLDVSSDVWRNSFAPMCFVKHFCMLAAPGRRKKN